MKRVFVNERVVGAEISRRSPATRSNKTVSEWELGTKVDLDADHDIKEAMENFAAQQVVLPGFFPISYRSMLKLEET